ncbi:hypothetical protein [Acinetobacter sp. ANC 3882]|uniref:hypothetical protein n=1 Tax=Acinetobacter sp. ANC 3882 TaxID=2923423 RepID=UPI001F4B7D56|nr:hypothetical protein [Acinetobacter sp. ANC 3882]MCH7315506.1 hypothetical protein [Acinetobacter sp. ANC 3882]
MKFLAVLSLITILSACATTPTTSESANVVPPQRIYQQSYFTKSEGTLEAKVVFFRDKGLTGFGCSYDLYINNQKSFSLKQNEQATIFLKPDSYIFRLETSKNNLCPSIVDSQEANIKSNAELEYRISLPSDANARLVRIK